MDTNKTTQQQMENTMQHEHEENESTLNSRFLRFFKTDASSKAALITATLTIGSLYIKLLDYLFLRGYLAHYGISIESVNYAEGQNLSSFLFYGVIAVGIMGCLSIWYLLLEEWRGKRTRYGFAGGTLRTLPLLAGGVGITALLNYLLTKLLASAGVFLYLAQTEKLTMMAILLGLELILALLLRPEDETVQRRAQKAKSTEEAKAQKGLQKKMAPRKEELSRKRPLAVELFSSLAALLLFACVACSYIGGMNTAEHQKVYSVIEDRYVVLYQNASNYYTVVTYEDITGEVILDATIQKVIPVENVEIQRDLLEPDMIILAE